jgi:Lon protease-like protein
MSDDPTFLGNFSGAARLFPLPDLVLFPAVVQPLHVFEPRYRQLTADSLASDRLIAIALLRPGWEEDYHLRPPIHPVVCLGRIFKEERFPDGRYNLLLHGVARARVLEEPQTDRPYRTARVELLPDVPPDSAEAGRDLRQNLGRQVRAWFATQAAALEQLKRLVKSPLPLGALCDIFAFALPLDVEFKQELLGEPDVGRRAARLLLHLEANAPAAPEAAGRRFPPEFSSN